VDSVDRVGEYETALRDYGVDFAYEGVVAHREGSASGGIFFHDPDGTRLEIYAPSGAEGAPVPSATAPTCGFF
jgi:lactoylglutathione lyase